MLGASEEAGAKFIMNVWEEPHSGDAQVAISPNPSRPAI